MGHLLRELVQTRVGTSSKIGSDVLMLPGDEGL
jgi:hypothetical protein